MPLDLEEKVSKIFATREYLLSKRESFKKLIRNIHRKKVPFLTAREQWVITWRHALIPAALSVYKTLSNVTLILRAIITKKGWKERGDSFTTIRRITCRPRSN